VQLELPQCAKLASRRLLCFKTMNAHHVILVITFKMENASLTLAQPQPQDPPVKLAYHNNLEHTKVIATRAI
jgi:hypothetical protein